MNAIYTTITLPISQLKCDILEIKPAIMWRAVHQSGKPENQHYRDCGIFPFILSEALLFNGEKWSVDRMDEELAIDDYTEINRVFDVMFTKFNIG